MLLASAQHGVSLIEMMIGIAILGILIMVGLPSYTAWIQNSQVRTAAESISNGLQLARAEAVRRNVPVRFQLTSAAGLSDWSIDASADGGTTFTVAVQSRSSAAGSPAARVGISSAAQPNPAYSVAVAAGTGLPAGVVFTSLGRANVGGITRADVTSATLAAADTRRLVLLITSGGQIRMCDPAVTVATDTRYC